MKVGVKDVLPCGSAVGLEEENPFTRYAAVWKRRRHTVNEPKDIGCFFFAQVAEFGGVAAWNYENVTGIDLRNVHEGDCMFVLGHYTGFQFAS